jgi:hypothetical protein
MSTTCSPISFTPSECVETGLIQRKYTFEDGYCFCDGEKFGVIVKYEHPIVEVKILKGLSKGKIMTCVLIEKPNR